MLSANFKTTSLCEFELAPLLGLAARKLERGRAGWLAMGKQQGAPYSITQFGQRSILPLLSLNPQQQTKRKASPSSLSLLEFLDRKTQKTNAQIGHQRKQLCGNDVVSTTDDLKENLCNNISWASESLKKAQKAKTGNSKSSQLSQNAQKPSSECVCSERTGERPKSAGHLQKKRPRKHSQGADQPINVLVIGGDSSDGLNLEGKRWGKERKMASFNHYDNVAGWWDMDMVGLDCEGVGSTGIWEGVGTMSLGEAGPPI